MSKTFDTMNRKRLFDELDVDELHLVKILISVELEVWNGTTQGNFFFTHTGTPQGDCLSVIQLTFYLPKTLDQLKKKSQLQTDTLNWSRVK